MSFSKQALEVLMNDPWPGNIRELQNTMERVVLICPEGIIEPQMLNHVLPFNYQQLFINPSETKEVIHAKSPADVSQPEIVKSEEIPVQQKHTVTKVNLQEIEKESILQALIDSHGIQTKAAALLGMTARQIGYKMRKYGIDL